MDLSVQPSRGLAALWRRLNTPGAEHRYGTDRWELLQVAFAELQARPPAGLGTGEPVPNRGDQNKPAEYVKAPEVDGV